MKRLRHSPRIELRPCNRLGRVKDGVAPVAGPAEIPTDEGSRARLTGIIREKDGVEYAIVVAIERPTKAGRSKRAILRIGRA